ncbi:glycosyltransferase [Aestuariimicrobium kwangyangense]|uniref:glycosyltransferase n=1 Tax=Aestuariimicrobium kwangyangense TaxID=396389 RepID=UPI0003B66966|nr:glycosyltransferase [Aestuariimicrobium kwangyangense]
MQGLQPRVHTLSVVIPVYRGEKSLTPVVEELLALAGPQLTPAGHSFAITEIMPVWDNGPDASDETIRSLQERSPLVRPVWLSRNFGQHPATMAGLASAGGDWIVTMDEDGQHDPAQIGRMLDTALAEQATVVYAQPSNEPPHGAFRNLASRLAKRILARAMGSRSATQFNSFRLILGETGRALSAFAGPGVYLDVALSWISRKVTSCPVPMRSEGRESSYTVRSLSSHFWRMVVTSGTRALRLVAFLGAIIGLLGLVLTVVVVVRQIMDPAAIVGWASLMCVILIGSGLILFSLGVVAEYLGVTVNQAMGKPLYLIVGDPEHGPLGRRDVTPDPQDA